MMRRTLMTVLMLAAALFTTAPASADSAAEIEANVNASLSKFRTTIGGGAELLDQSKGVLVFPEVFKAGFVFGGEYGEGALKMGGRTAGYYSLAAGSFGLQIGAQKKSILILFMTERALNKFRNASGWKIGVDASVALITVGAGGSIDTDNINAPVVAVVMDQKGLMANLTLEGSKISRINR
ncbi:MAG: YSC84-related protein [Alphaproteobacteria bacterium]